MIFPIKNTLPPLLFEALGLFVGALVLFTVGLSTQEIIGFESRFYLFDLEMWRHGWQWFPTTYLTPYPDYPVTATFCSYVMAHLFGGMNKLSAVFPSAVAAAIVVTMTYLLGALHDKKWGLCAVFFLALTVTFVKAARSISLDMYPTMITICCFYLIYSAEFLHKPARLWWIYPLLIVGFAFRGPIGLVIPTGVVCIYYFIRLDFKKSLLIGSVALLLLVACTAGLLALANHVGGQAFMQAVLDRQVLGRLNHDALPFYYYFTNSFISYALSYPMAWLVVIGMLIAIWQKKMQSTEKNLLVSLSAWVLVILVGMSIPGDKKMRYILPMVPALALIAAYPFAFAKATMPLVRLRRIAPSLFLYFPVLCLLLVEAIHFYLKGHNVPVPIYTKTIIVILIILQLLNFWLIFQDILASGGNTVFILFIGAVCFILLNVLVMEPIQLHKESARSFVEAVEKQRLRQQAVLVFYRLHPDGFPIKYVINMPEEQQPVFLNDEVALVRFNQPAFFVAKAADFSALSSAIKKQLRIVAYENVAHVNVVVFTKTPASYAPLNKGFS